MVLPERTQNPVPAVASGLSPVGLAIDDSIGKCAVAGWVIIVAFFGVLGTWAAVAPLHGAVVASGVIKVEGNRKSVQHLEGGIVKEVRVREGDYVRSGAILAVLDETQARSEYEVLGEQFVSFRAAEERLRTELERGEAPALPDDLRNLGPGRSVAMVWAGQLRQFEQRKAAADAQRKVIREKISQLEHQVSGALAQAASFRTQLDSVRGEMISLRGLLDKGLIPRSRYLQLERTEAALEGQLADSLASAARFRQAVAEQNQQLGQIENERMADTAKELRETQAKILETIPKLLNARATLGRMEIRSPYSGRVVALSVFSVGGVIQRGEKILDIVPDRESLVVEAQIPVEDIADIRPGMPADISLTAYKQRITPTVRGVIITVSADRLTDPHTGAASYLCEIGVGDGEMAKLPQIKLYPGMPAMVTITTEERTALDYLLGPLTIAFHRAFRQK